MIQINLRAGGLKLIQVQDDGHGIEPADLPILCQRFTTSKLKDFEGLLQLKTFGFRGEALASLSYVTSRMTVISRPRGYNCAHRAEYSGGALVSPSEGGSSAPRPCAGNPGTSVQAEDLFYNLPSRRDALPSPREEFRRVAEIVARYSLHYAGKCGFFLRSLDRKAGSAASPMSVGGDLRTTKDWTKEHVIRALFGEKIASDLLYLSSREQNFDSESVRLAVDKLGLKLEGLLTSPAKVTSEGTPSVQVVLFVNNRLAECSSLKRAIEAAYVAALPHRAAQIYSGQLRKSVGSANIVASSSSNASLFVYLSLEMPTASLDVNVHPTKSQVHFLHEDEIISGVKDAVEQTLFRSTGTRNVLVRSLDLKSSQEERQVPLSSVQSSSHSLCSSPVSRQTNISVGSSSSPRPFAMISSPLISRPDRLVRTDARDQRLEAFAKPSPSHSSLVVEPSQSPSPEISGSESEDEFSIKSPRPDVCFTFKSPRDELRLPKVTRRPVLLGSVQTMREAVEARASADARNLLRDCVYVGCVSRSNCLVQHSTSLLLLRLYPLTKELFYQLAVANFANHGEMILSNPASVSTLLSYELTRQLPEASASEVSVIVEKGCSVLTKRSAMLWDYFSLRVEVDANGVLQLYSLPLLLERFVPDMRYLPKLLTRLVREVNWNEEGACFSAVCRILASFYAECVKDGVEVKPTMNERANNLDEIVEQEQEGVEKKKCEEEDENQGGGQYSTSTWNWTVEHVLLPAIRTILLPSHTMCFPTSEEKSPAVLKLTSLPDLYRVFERC
ncbi:hypothetical protein Aperf_G00000118052 [Anoplocephala perfoliata]